MRVALVSDENWAQAIPEARGRGAEVICLPHFSFGPYVPAQRDRAGLETAERPVSRSFREALNLAGDAWVSASSYESAGEGVFYVTARLARAGEPGARYRQRHVEAAAGRYEQMFFSPGHEPFAAAELPCGPTAPLVGYDLRVPSAWAELAALGVRVVLGGASEPARLWAITERTAAGMAAAYGVTVLIANRYADGRGTAYGGGCAAFDPTGAPLERDADALFDLGPAR